MRPRNACDAGLSGSAPPPLDAAVFGVVTLALLLLYAVVVVMSLIGMFVFTALLQLRLKTHHPDVWAQRGSGIGQQVTGSLWSRVWGRRYDDLADPAMLRIASLYRICASVFIGSVIVGAAVAVLTRLVHVGGL